MTSRVLERFARPTVPVVLVAALLWLVADRTLRVVGRSVRTPPCSTRPPI